jgi:hypothetical protein
MAKIFKEKFLRANRSLQFSKENNQHFSTWGFGFFFQFLGGHLHFLDLGRNTDAPQSNNTSHEFDYGVSIIYPKYVGLVCR